MKQKRCLLSVLFVLLAALALLAAVVYASGVTVVTYPRHVTGAIPYNDDSEGRPAYRLNMPGASPAPFAVILRIVGHKNQQAYFWLTDDQTGNTVQTYNRFAVGATKDLTPTTHWLDESATRPGALAPVAITTDIFYLMVVGRVTGTVGSPIVYSANYEIGAVTGSVPFTSTLVVSDCNNLGWYLNWNDTDPETGDPAAGADFVELFDSGGNSYTTAPVDWLGYFEVVLPPGAAGQTWSAEARTESLIPVRSWLTPIASQPITCTTLINAGTGGPTRVELTALTARTTPPLAPIAALALLLLPLALLLSRRRKG